jgi:predicted acyltransferase
MSATQTVASATASSLPVQRPTSRRLVSIDVYRGVTVAAMILVTDPGTYAHVYAQLSHSVWNGATLTDMIAPSFLFLVGVGLSFSFASRFRQGATRFDLARHVLLRVAGLILVGLILNGFPDFDLRYLRIPGILQHIAVCLLFGGWFHAFTGRVVPPNLSQPGSFRANWTVLCVVMILFVAADWILMKWVPVPGYGAGHLDPFGNMGGFIDRTLFGTNHLWQWGNYWWDPDGMLTTLPASANLMLGILAGEVLCLSAGRMKAIQMLLGGGVLLLAAGLLLDPIYPINKKIWTPSYTLLSGGFCLLAMGLSHWIFDGARSAKGESIVKTVTLPARIFGTNAILAFVFSTVITTMASRISVPDILGHTELGHTPKIPQACYEIFAQAFSPKNASLAYALLIVLLNLLLLVPFHRKGISIKI